MGWRSWSLKKRKSKFYINLLDPHAVAAILQIKAGASELNFLAFLELSHDQYVIHLQVNKTIQLNYLDVSGQGFSADSSHDTSRIFNSMNKYKIFKACESYTLKSTVIV